jgi:hypothetical protein
MRDGAALEHTTRIGDRMPVYSTSGLRRLWHDHGLSVVLIVLFLLTFAGQVGAGWLGSR